MIPLKNMINDVYAKDISRKIITSFRARQEKGEFLPSFAPYGYVKSKTVQYRYEVDPETAPYVKMIFEWKVAGVSYNEICRRLNEKGAVTPARRKVELGIWQAEKHKDTIWYRRTIIDILKNPTYTGWYALSQEKLMRKMRGSTKEKNLLDSYTAKVNFLQQEQTRIDTRRAGLFENFAEGILDEEEYRFAKKKYDEESVTVGEKLTAARKAKAELDAVLSFDNKWIAAMHRAENEEVLSESLVKDLIRKVCVYEDNRVEVELNYGEEKALMERILAELEKGDAVDE